MINPQILGKKINSLREEANMSQEELAKKIGLSRVAISQIEQGKRGVEFLELAKIAEVFKLKTDYFLIDENLPDIKKDKTNISYKFNPKKLKSVILYILEKCAGKPNLGETVLYKLLYFIDFDHFEIYHKPITGLDYVHLQFGPAPAAKQYSLVIEEMKKNNELKIIPQDYFGMRIKRYLNLVSYQIGSLTPQEEKIVSEIINYMSDWSAGKIEEYSHDDAPWQQTADKKIIDYNLVFNRVPPYSHADYSPAWQNSGGRDILKDLGPISKEEAEYYENL